MSKQHSDNRCGTCHAPAHILFLKVCATDFTWKDDRVLLLEKENTAHSYWPPWFILQGSRDFATEFPCSLLRQSLSVFIFRPQNREAI